MSTPTGGARRALARKLHDLADTTAGKHRQTYRATVLVVEPLTVQLLDHSITLDDQEFEISHSVHQFMLRHKFKHGDTVVMTHDGDWLMTDVLRIEHDHIDTGSRPGHPGSLPKRHRGTMKVYDKNGHFIGRVPLI